MWKIKSCSVSSCYATKKLASPLKTWNPEGAEAAASHAESYAPSAPHCKYTLRATELSLKMSSFYLAKEQRRILKSANRSKKTKYCWQIAQLRQPTILVNFGSLYMASWPFKSSNSFRSNVISHLLKMAHCQLFQKISVSQMHLPFKNAYVKTIWAV